MNSWVGFDLDGTLADQYWPTKGKYDPYRIGEPISEMVEHVRRLLRLGYDVRVFTARVGPQGSAPPSVIPNGEDVELIRQAIRNSTRIHVGTPLEATCVKDYAMVALYDDRAVHIIMHNTGHPCCCDRAHFALFPTPERVAAGSAQ